MTIEEILSMRRVVNTCGCGAELVGDTLWKRLTVEQRDVLRSRGLRRAAKSTQCLRCWQRARSGASTGRRIPVADVADDWTFLADPSRTQIANVRTIAPRLGMTESALERAVLRAKQLGLVAA